MARNTKRTQVTADTTPADLIAGLSDASDARTLDAALDALTRLDSAVAVRTFDTTLAVKRAVGQVLSLHVKRARAAGGDAGKVGADGAAITFAHVSAALGHSGTDWEHCGRKRATLSDDLNAWHDCTPARVRTFRTMADDARTLGARTLSPLNVQHCVQWCHADANPDRTTNRQNGTRSDLHKRVEITQDDRVAASSTLAAAATTGGDVLSAPIALAVNGTQVTTPAPVTPAWLAGLSDDALSAVILACEGERKRRAVARDAAGKGKPAPAAPASPAVAAIVDSVAAPAAPALTPAQVDALMSLARTLNGQSA